MTGSSWSRLRTRVDDWQRRRRIARYQHTLTVLGKPARHRTMW